MFKYKVNFYGCDIHDIITEQGLANGKDYSDAATRIVEYYGSENIVDLFLKQVENVIPQENITDCFKEEKNSGTYTRKDSYYN